MSKSPNAQSSLFHQCSWIFFSIDKTSVFTNMAKDNHFLYGTRVY
ncbi:hypothetical protein SAMN02745216_02968 [Desulfatibacillum alkenivorans DSM 16219]|uniref:Uncharacterized protein n=1 Tax=Desulfatibacillum alkenivorans DSM 16219 TaxID=1121393 RepID=A0A1M6Q5X8_9BACT|nr:hypothetical protein SAMN02745216_02968 [Desulfatibacillum alkenivorans DSM 16219]